MRRLARIAGGATLLLMAMALVMLHQSWRNSPAAGQPQQVVSTEGVTASSPDQERDGKVRVFVQYTANDRDAARAVELATFLKSRGFAVAAVRSVGFRIHQPSVRYFFDDDRPDGEKLVEAVRAFFAGTPAQAPDHATGLTGDPEKTRDGELEVWLASS